MTYLTEDEAKTRWCPMARVLHSYNEGTSHNRDTSGDPVGNCIGSACMMWRREYSISYADQGTAYQRGRCGLAGEPK